MTTDIRNSFCLYWNWEMEAANT